MNAEKQIRAFTLVEVLVVIAIIGLLVALLLPAIQAARESARRTQCTNNLKQMGLAIQSHHDSQRYYPKGRDGLDNAAASWAFRLLPYIEQEPLYKSRDESKPVYDAANSSAMRTPVSLFYCPSRRSPAADRDFPNGLSASPLQEAGAGGDYAANAGREKVDYGLDEHARPVSYVDGRVAGPIYTLSRISARRVEDGLSHTIAVGERHLPPPPPTAPPGQVHLAQGDTAFFAGDIPWTILRIGKEGLASGADDESNEKFGSDHAGISHFVMLDGHVQKVRDEIDPSVFQWLTSISDGEILSDDLL